jgi:hypothetical protein
MVDAGSAFAADQEWCSSYHHGKITIYFCTDADKQVTGDYKTAYDAGISAWNSTMSNDVKYSLAFKSTTPATAKSKAIYCNVGAGNFGNVGWAGTTGATGVVVNSKKVITAGKWYILLNVPGMKNYSLTMRKSVVAHEMGHVTQLGDMYSASDRLMGATTKYTKAQSKDITTLKKRY